MTFVNAVATCMTKYVDFSGRASRSEYWWFALFIIAGGILLSMLSENLSLAFYLVTLLPSFAAAARRLHDRNLSGWFQLIALIPLIGIFILLYLLAQQSTGPNQYGEPVTES